MKRTNPTRICLFLLLYLSLPHVAAASIPEGYYTKADGKKKTTLKAALHDIIQPKYLLSYGSGSKSTWSGFYVTDRMSDNQVIDRYSNDKRYFSSSDNANSAKPPSGMNIEHSFPKSWWGGQNNNAYKDLYNLMPCESGINSSKSNYAMGRVTTVKVNNGCTKVGKGTTSSGTTKQLWEPADKWKGDFARDYFYMVTAYSNLKWESNGLDMLENNDWPSMQKWAYTLLLQWARQDPVDEIERKRNDDVYSIQKNRNPFVDFPNLAEYIWGDSIEYTFYVNGTATDDDDDENDDDYGYATLVNCSMRSGFGPFFIRTSEGCEGKVWTSDATYGAKATARSFADKEADEYLMVNLDLTHAETATLTFQHATGYNKSVTVKDTYFQVLVSEDYDGVPEDATWEMLNVTFPPLPSGSNYSSYVSSGDISLTYYSGKEITLAFRFQSHSYADYCWEVRDVKVTAHTVADGLPFITEDDGWNVQSPMSHERCYNLSGQQVPSVKSGQIPWNAKGIVIRSGKKFLRM